MKDTPFFGWLRFHAVAIAAVFVCTLLTVSPATPASAAPEAARATVEALQARALEDGLAWRLLSSLTTDVGPRMAGSPGDAKAVAWAQQQMKRLGFDRVWAEPVSFPRWERRSETASIQAPRFQPLAVTALGGSPATHGRLEAEVVRFASLADLEAASADDVTGKIVFIDGRMERGATGESYGEVVPQRGKGPYVAREKGATALIIRSVGTDNNRLAHTGAMSKTEGRGPVPSAAISNPDADLLDAMLAEGQAVVVSLELDCGFDGEATSYNVIGEFAGSDPDAGFVLVGGHLDSWDLGTGAIDDGTGVSITMAASRLVADVKPRPRRGIRVVLFANEEQGVYGGRAYAAAHAEELSRHVIGAESDLGGGRIYQFRSRTGESAEPALEELAELLEPLGIPRVLEPQAYGGADVGQMMKLGMPAIDLDHDATRYFDYHHTANDTLDKVTPEDLRFNVAAYVTFLWFAANTEAAFGPL
ncbi:MAG: M28 family peptidase [Lysobacterales bacterium]|jgi:Zn-dependent M28 family amino/carboxypeptidase